MESKAISEKVLEPMTEGAIPGEGPYGLEHSVVKLTIDSNSSPSKLRAGLYQACAALFFPFCGVSKEQLPAVSEEDGKDSVPSAFDYTTLQGGITNQLYKCTFDGKHPVLVRIYGAKTEEVIDRQRENFVVNILSAKRFAPSIYGRFDNGRLEQVLPGKSLSPDEMLLGNIVPKIGQRLALMHSLDIPLDKSPVMWTTLQGWLAKALAIRFDDNAEKASLLASIDLAKYQKEMEELKAKLLAEEAKYASKTPVVFAHNDLLSGNVMYDAPTEAVFFVDYEYGAYNYRAFDIANHFCECCGFDCDWNQFPNREQQFVFLRAYLAQTLKVDASKVTEEQLQALYLEIQPWILAPHLFWAFWGVVQSRYSPIDFDYLGYAKLRLDGYQMMKDKCLAFLSEN